MRRRWPGEDPIDMSFTCKFCGNQFDSRHRLPERHNCEGLAKWKEQRLKDFREGRAPVSYKENFIETKKYEPEGQKLRIPIAFLFIVIALVILGFILYSSYSNQSYMVQNMTIGDTKQAISKNMSKNYSNESIPKGLTIININKKTDNIKYFSVSIEDILKDPERFYTKVGEPEIKVKVEGIPNAFSEETCCISDILSRDLKYKLKLSPNENISYGESGCTSSIEYERCSSSFLGVFPVLVFEGNLIRGLSNGIELPYLNASTKKFVDCVRITPYG